MAAATRGLVPTEGARTRSAIPGMTTLVPRDRLVI